MCGNALATPALSFAAPGPCEGPGGVDIFDEDDSNVAGRLFGRRCRGYLLFERSIEELNGLLVPLGFLPQDSQTPN